MKEEELAEVFGAEGAPAEGPLPPPEDDIALDEEEGAALDMAIDEAFEATDPMARREAFKRAVELCKSGAY